MSDMYSKSSINGMELANRFVRSATYEGMATETGYVTPALVSNVANLARGGVGMIITGQTYISPEGLAAPRQLGIYEDDQVSGLSEMVSAVHTRGGKIVVQLAHAGKVAVGTTPLVISKSADPGSTNGKEIGPTDIADLVAAFTKAAVRAKRAGFDGVQLHMAHGYLLSQFLNPGLNQRQDQYGGSIENRSRIHVEIIKSVREAVGKDYPVLIKLNSQDFTENGLSLDDSLRAAQILAAAGIDAIELSGGVIWSTPGPSRTKIKMEEDEAYFQNEAQKLRELINIPLILVGGMRSFRVAERIVENGIADYISLCRPLIREPELINRWKSGNYGPSLCISCNQCFKMAFSGGGVACGVITERK